MPWAVSASRLITVADEPHPDAIAWADENPWYYQDVERCRTAQLAHIELSNTRPDLTIQQNLACVLTTVRLKFPGRLPDYGFVHLKDQGWVGCAPIVGMEDPILARPHCSVLTVASGTLPGRDYDAVWLMPIDSVPGEVDAHVMRHLVAALDRGGVVAVMAGDPANLAPARAAILHMVGWAGCA